MRSRLHKAPPGFILLAIILRPKPFPRHSATLASAPSTAPTAPVPAWLRRAIPDAHSLAGKGVGPNALEDVALAAGAAIGALDAVVRRQEKWAGAWRQRLALAAAASRMKARCALPCCSPAPAIFCQGLRPSAPPAFCCSPGADWHRGRRRN